MRLMKDCIAYALTTIFMNGDAMADQFTVVGAGFFCADIIHGQEYPDVMLGGTAANVLTVLSSLGLQTTMICADYQGAWGRWLKNSFSARNISTYCFSRTRVPLSRVVEKLDSKSSKHKSYSVCPVCGRKLVKCVLPGKHHINKEIDSLIEDVNVFFYDRISSGINEMVEKNINGWNYYEPNSCRNYQAFLEAAKKANILKFSASKIPEVYSEALIQKLQDSEIQLVIMTMGDRGVRFSCREKNGSLCDWIAIAPFNTERLVDATGAGDWVSAILIFSILKEYPYFVDTLDCTKVENMLCIAMKIATFICGYIGAQGIFKDKAALDQLQKQICAKLLPFEEILPELQDECYFCMSEYE